MGKNSKITVAAIFALAMAGCGSDNPPAPTTTPTQGSNPVPNPSVVAKALQLPQSKSPTSSPLPFQNPVVPGKFSTSNRDLIPPTNVSADLSLVQKGRPDPFAQIVGQLVPSAPDDTTTKIVPKLPPLTIAKKPSSLITSYRPKTPPLVLPKVIPQVVPSPDLKPLLPPPAQAELAKSVMVTGVILVGDQPQAIIKVPNEPTSRYVEVGQPLAGGVLVKRIEMNGDSDPVVILEQDGIEVPKMVGEKPPNAEKPGTANS